MWKFASSYLPHLYFHTQTTTIFVLPCRPPISTTVSVLLCIHSLFLLLFHHLKRFTNSVSIISALNRYKSTVSLPFSFHSKLLSNCTLHLSRLLHDYSSYTLLLTFVGITDLKTVSNILLSTSCLIVLVYCARSSIRFFFLSEMSQTIYNRSTRVLITCHVNCT